MPLQRDSNDSWSIFNSWPKSQIEVVVIGTMLKRLVMWGPAVLFIMKLRRFPVTHYTGDVWYRLMHNTPMYHKRQLGRDIEFPGYEGASVSTQTRLFFLLALVFLRAMRWMERFEDTGGSVIENLQADVFHSRDLLFPSSFVRIQSDRIAFYRAPLISSVDKRMRNKVSRYHYYETNRN